MSQLMIDAAVDVVVDCCQPAEVRLCGSYATGEFTAASDLDLMVIVAGHDSADATVSRLRERFARWPVEVDVMVRDRDQLTAALADPLSFESRLMPLSRTVYARTESEAT